MGSQSWVPVPLKRTMKSLDFTQKLRNRQETYWESWGSNKETLSSIMQFCPGLALFSSYDLWLWEIPKHLHDFALSSFCFLERFKYIWTADIDTKFCLAWKCSRNFSSYVGDSLSYVKKYMKLMWRNLQYLPICKYVWNNRVSEDTQQCFNCPFLP